MVKHLTKKEFYDLTAKQQKEMLKGLGIEFKNTDKEGVLHEKYEAYWSIKEVVVETETTVPIQEVQKQEIKNEVLLCPKCSTNLKHIKNYDYVCENGHGLSGWPPG